MAFLPVYNCYHPVLKKKTEKIKEINGEIDKLVRDMFETMYNAEGIGLAANQVGISKSLIIIDTSAGNIDEQKKHPPPMAMINPVIESFSDEEIEFNEGCLSIPKFYEKVWRPSQIQVKYWDLDMKEHVLEVDNLLARVIQHEIDHLNGILFFEKLTPIRRTLARNKLKNIKNGKVKPDYKMILSDGSLLK